MTEPRPPPRRNCRSALRRIPCCRHGCGSRAEGQVTVSPGKVEIGQGIVTALAQIAADELDIDIGRVQMVRASTAASPNEGVTSGSLSVQQSGRAIRHACAEVRQIFLERGVGSPGRRHRRARRSRTAPSRVPAMSGPAIGSSPSDVSLDRDATPGADAQAVSAARAGRKFGSADGYSRQGFRACPLHPRSGAARDAAWPRAAVRRMRRRNSSN